VPLTTRTTRKIVPIHF